jgi:hypothetical protein
MEARRAKIGSQIFLAHARKYAALGWATFPLARGSKVPIAGSDGFKSASADPATVAMRARRHPNANIGLATGKISGVIVIDIDPRNGGNRTVERLEKQGKRFPKTVEATSCQGGRHLYYAYDAKVKRSGKDALGRGIDVKMDGGYVVAPPSIWSKNGQSYRWLRSPWRSAPGRLPSWIFKALRPRPRAKPSGVRPPASHALDDYRRQGIDKLEELAEHMAGLADGRHQAPFIMACCIGTYHRHGFLSAAEVEQAFLAASARNGALGKYARGDLLQQIRNGLRRAVNDDLPPLERPSRGRRPRAAR